MEIVVVTKSIPLSEVKRLATVSYGEMVKAVADIEKQILAIGGEYHADAEKVLLEQGSLQEHLWGFNIYPELSRDQWLEYFSLINIRPRQKNMGYVIESTETQMRISDLCNTLII